MKTVHCTFSSLNKDSSYEEGGEWDIYESSLTKDSSYEEGGERDIYDRGGDVDEPVGQERSDPEEQDVVSQVVAVSLHLRINTNTVCSQGPVHTCRSTCA